MCLNCQRQGEACDYSVRLNWGGRTKRSSVDSPSSQSSGFGGTLIGFADVTPTSVNPAQMPTPMTSAPAEGFIHVRAGDLGSPGAISPSTPALGIFESPKPHPASEGVHSPTQGEGHFATTWAEHSSLSSSVSPGQFPFGQGFHGSFSAAADQGVGLRSLSAFAFHSPPVSQPVSFLRNSVDASNDLSDPSPHHNQNEAQLSPHNEHGMGYSMNTTHPDGHHRDLPGAGGFAALMLGSHEVGTPGTSSSGHDGMAFGSTPANQTESLHSFHQSDMLSPDAKEDDRAAKDANLAQSKWQAYLTSVTDNYGLDCGRPDRDLAFNNDHAAIDINAALDIISSRGRSEDTASSPVSRAASDILKPDYSGYYATPVAINIPRYLSPLPKTLLENPINLMYFHHFLNHTSRMLVPHDCDNNPFISVLPASKFFLCLIFGTFFSILIDQWPLAIPIC